VECEGTGAKVSEWIRKAAHRLHLEIMRIGDAFDDAEAKTSRECEPGCRGSLHVYKRRVVALTKASFLAHACNRLRRYQDTVGA
jgi:hypothetical protein